VFPSSPPDNGRDPWVPGPRSGQPGGAGGPADPGPGQGRVPQGGVYGGATSVGAQAAKPGHSTPGHSTPGHSTAGHAAGHSTTGRSTSTHSTGGHATTGMFGTIRPELAGLERAKRDDEEHGHVEVVPVRQKLSIAIAGFAGLLGAGLILGAQTSGPDARLPYGIVVFGVQLLFILAWTMAMRPPALKTVAAMCVLVAAAADAAAVTSATATLAPLGYVAAGGFVLAVLGQLLGRTDRARTTDSLGSTLLIVVGVVAFATLIVLTRRPAGTQAVVLCLTATGIALVVARLVDAVFPKPRVAPQVPRGATGIVLGAMLGTLGAAGLGSVMLPFTPAKGAILGLVAAGAAGLVDLAVNYSEASRNMAGEAPTFWVARHMQGPLGAFALAAPAAYGLAVLFLA
jgi:hypothetical protein